MSHCSEKYLLDIWKSGITYTFFGRGCHTGINIFYPTGALFLRFAGRFLAFPVTLPTTLCGSGTVRLLRFTLRYVIDRDTSLAPCDDFVSIVCYSVLMDLLRSPYDNIYVTNKIIYLMKLFKITKEETWNKNGVPTNYVNFMKAYDIKEVLLFFGIDNIIKVEEL